MNSNNFSLKDASKPVVSVCCITYNHQKYIRDCLDGILSQETDFDYEIVIHDDASTDNTLAIIKEYQQQYPKLIKVIAQKENVYSKNLNPISFALPHCEGDYIALCAGDDYWCDNEKLRTQKDFLEKNKDYSIVLSWSHLLKNQTLQQRALERDLDFELPDFVREMKIGSAASSIMARNTNAIQNAFKTVALDDNAGGDWLLCIVSLKHGKMRVLAKGTIVYRIHEESIYSMKSWLTQFKIHLKTANKIDELLEHRFNTQIRNFNARKLLLKYSSKTSELTRQELLNTYYEIEKSTIKRFITRAATRTFTKYFYCKYLSKLLHIKTSI